MRIRGAAQDAVQQAYADIHEMMLHFLAKPGTEAAIGRTGMAVTRHARVEPAPTVVEVEQTLARPRQHSCAARTNAIRRPRCSSPQTCSGSSGRRWPTATSRTATALTDFGVGEASRSGGVRQLKSQALERAGRRRRRGRGRSLRRHAGEQRLASRRRLESLRRSSQRLSGPAS